MNPIRTIAISCLVLVSAATRLCAGPFTQIVVFGDSLTDTGNVFNLTANTFPALPPYYNGRFSNGPVWVEYLAAGLGLPAPTPSRLGGTNFAYGGAETSLSGVSTRNTPNIGTQVTAYFDNHPAPDSNRLFVIWGGADDFLHFPTRPLPDPSLPVSNLVTEITQLAQQAGARNFLVPNLPLLGETPYVKQQLAPTFPGIEATMNSLTVQFDSKLAVAESNLETSLGVNIYRLDTAGLFQQLLTNPGDFGVTNVSDQAKSGATGIPGVVVPNPNQYLFWDGIHPTETVHLLGGNAAIATIVPEPASLSMLSLGLVAVGMLAWRSRVA
jgi:phospholipase/lecithinase/hemolysin